MNITFLGHSGLHILIESADRKFELLVDPFLTGNPLAKHSSETINADYILLTHAHSDHYGDTEEIAKR